MTNVHTSYRTAPLGYLPSPTVEHPEMISMSKGNVAHFKDGSSVQIDVLIFATGYEMHYPFMEKSLRLSGQLRYYHKTLYKVKTCK